MPILYRRPLSAATLSAGAEVDLSQALDLADYREVHVVLTVDQAGDGETPVLVVRHAAVNEAGAYVDFDTPAQRTLSSTGTSWFHADSFTRWVMWFVSGTLNADAVVTVDVIAKP